MSQGVPVGTVAPMVLAEESRIEALAHSIVEVNASVLSQRGFSVGIGLVSFKEEQVNKAISVVAASFSVHFGVGPDERFDDLFDQISLFALHLAKDHIFTDGNKRTTVLVSLALIGTCGIALDIEDSERPEDNDVYKWIEDLVTGSRSTEELASILRDRARLA